MDQTFLWWAEIWIPAGVGAVTLVIAVAALVSSSRATALSHQLERERRDEDTRRAADSDRTRLLDLALSDARALMRWVHIASTHRMPEISSRRVGDPAPPLTPRKAAATDAIVALEQSFVPGALELLRITQFDIDNWALVRESAGSTDLNADGLRSLRIQRTIERIRQWALDPTATTPRIKDDLNLSSQDPESYLVDRLEADVAAA